jgi:hypothetical protein
MSVETEPSRTSDGAAGYAPPSERPPLAWYAGLAGVFSAGMTGALVAARASDRELPERIGPGDLVLVGTASHKLSRLIAKDKVTAFLRAPFTRYEGTAGPAELDESPRGTGAQRAVGEMLACPYCLGLWASAGFHVGLLFAPRPTRFAASILSALTISDFLQIAYKAAEDRGLGGS